MEKRKTRSREREPCCSLIWEFINLTAVPHFLKVSSDTLLDEGFYLYPSQTWALVCVRARVLRARACDRSRTRADWGMIPLGGVCLLLFILKPAFIHRIGCFDWQRHRRVNALLVMQLKSVKPQTPALLSDAYFIIAPLYPFLPGVEALLSTRLTFSPY